MGKTRNLFKKIGEGFPGRSVVKNPPTNAGISWWFRGQRVCLQCRRPEFNPWFGKSPWRRKWQPTPVFLPGKSHGWRNLEGYRPQRSKDSETVTSLSPVQETWVHSLVWEDPHAAERLSPCTTTTKPVPQSLGAVAAAKPQLLRTMQPEGRAPQEKSHQ